MGQSQAGPSRLCGRRLRRDAARPERRRRCRRHALLIAFKIPVCAATIVLAAPLAGATGLAPTEQAQRIRYDLDEGLVQNCGPPYVLPVQ